MLSKFVLCMNYLPQYGIRYNGDDYDQYLGNYCHYSAQHGEGEYAVDEPAIALFESAYRLGVF